jgi:hypothetical protein
VSFRALVLMDLLAPILAYLGAVTGIVVATVLSYDSLFVKPSYAPPVAQATTAVAARSSPAKMTKPRARRKAQIGRAPVSVKSASGDDAGTRTAALQRLDRAKERSRHLANERSRRRLAHRLPAPKQWAYRPVPRAPYAFRSAEGPRGPFGFE